MLALCNSNVSFTKDEILTIYLNRVYLGAGTWGIDAAAQTVFRQTGGTFDPVRGGDDRRPPEGAIAL